MMTEVETRARPLQAKEPLDCREPPEDRKRQGRILPCGIQREHGPTDTLIWTSSFQTVKKLILLF